MIQTLFQYLVNIPTAHARPLQTGQFGIEQESGALTITDIGLNVLNVGMVTITTICAAVFIAGAFLLSSSAGDETRKSLGKDLMINAVIGIAIVAGTKAILNLTYSFLYGG